MKIQSSPGGETHSVELERIEDGYRTATGRPGAETTLIRGPEVRIWSVLTENGLSFEVIAERNESDIEVVVGQGRFPFGYGATSRSSHRPGVGSGRLEVKSPMPGKVVKILVSEGETVAAGQPVLLFEAMKMQNELRSPQGGVVARIEVEAGQAIEARELLYILDSP